MVGGGHLPDQPRRPRAERDARPDQLPRRYQNVQMRADVPRLENGWVDLDYSLVDRKTQQVYEAYGAAERYSGRDSDGDWSEGSRGTAVSIASVPAGSYDLVVDYKGNRWTGATSYTTEATGWMDPSNAPEVKVEVRHGVVYFSNLLIALILIAIPLLFAAHRACLVRDGAQGRERLRSRRRG
jgi:hypothetical protein